MRRSDGSYRIILFPLYVRAMYSSCGGHMGIERERVISIVLSEAEWQAFVARHPEPVVWLRERIRDDAATSEEFTISN